MKCKICGTEGARRDGFHLYCFTTKVQQSTEGGTKTTFYGTHAKKDETADSPEEQWTTERIEEEVRRKFQEAQEAKERAKRKAEDEERTRQNHKSFDDAFNAFLGGRVMPTVKQDVVQVDVDISRLRKLMMLCHPDKHGNSELSAEVTMWLIEIRKKLVR